MGSGVNEGALSACKETVEVDVEAPSFTPGSTIECCYFEPV